jgi:phosphoenolpyruvate synthase/pyruvate phosphate dikinase
MTYIAWLNEGTLAREDVGGKGASLSALAAAGFEVPPGFCVTAEAYRQFSAANGLDARIEALIKRVDVAQPGSMAQTASEIEALVAAAELPEQLRTAVTEAYRSLRAEHDMACAVRSSAVSEDGSTASFAGLYETFLNVRSEQDILGYLHKCYVSLWAERAVGYRVRNGGGHDEAMAVVIMGLVPADSSGIAFTAHPVTGSLDTVVINSSWGLGEAIVSGRVTPDSFIVTKGSWQIVERDIYPKQIATHPQGAGTADVPVERSKQNQPSLTDDQVTQVAMLAAQVETHYGSPQDVEWALAGDDLYLLQARPITTL